MDSDGGDTVALTDDDTDSPTFTAPSTSTAQTLTFRLTVTDDDGDDDTDSVDVAVAAMAVTIVPRDYRVRVDWDGDGLFANAHSRRVMAGLVGPAAGQSGVATMATRFMGGLRRGTLEAVLRNVPWPLQQSQQQLPTYPVDLVVPGRLVEFAVRQ